MKVLYDHQIFAAQKFGGISRYFSEISSPSIGVIDTEIVNHLDFPNFDQNLVSKGFRFLKHKFRINNRFADEKYPQILQDRLLKNDFDVFHPTYYDPYFIPFIEKPFVLTVHDMIHELYPEYFGLDESICEYKQFLCEKAELILAVSETTKNDLIDIYKVKDTKIHVTFLGTDFDKVIPIKPLIKGEFDNYILFSGHRGLYKNFYFMIRALVDFMITDKSLKLICTGNPFSEMELSYFKKLGIEKNIYHLYAKTDSELAWLYQNALCFIFPSLYEGFGIPLLEAFASKCPVISSNGGSLYEIGGKGVKFFNPKSVIELQDAVSDVIFNSNTRQNLIHNGLKELEKYSWDKCRNETTNAYKLLI